MSFRNCLPFWFQVNGQVANIPVNLLRGKIKVSHKGGKTLLKTEFGLHVVFNGNSAVLVKLDPHYKGKVYGLCGNFNGEPKDEYPEAMPGSPPINTSVEFALAYQLFDGENCFTEDKLEEANLPADDVSGVASSHKKQCAVFSDQSGPTAHCHNRVDPGSFYRSCLVDHMLDGSSNNALHQAIHSYSVVCEESDVTHGEVMFGKYVAAGNIMQLNFLLSIMIESL